jgi:signal transduction histidine kinase/streptogramin lyase
VYILHLPEQPRTDVYSMVQSRDGDLWVVTTAMAIYRYRDSLLVHVYQLNDVVPFQIIEDGPGNFLLRTDKGVLEFTGDRGPAENANSFAIEDILPGGWGGPIIIDREKTLWAGTWTRGLLKIADRRLINFSVPAMAGCVADTSGHLWFGDAKGLVEVYTDNEGGWYSHHHSIGKIGDARLSPQWQCDSRGRLWFSLPGSPPSLRCYRIDSHPHQPSSIVSLYDIKLPRGDFWSFLVDRQDRCWLLLGALTATIIDLATMKNVRVFTTADGLPQARAYTLFQDRRDNVWIGTWASGLARINAAGDLSGKFRIFTVSDGLPHDGVRSISEDSDGDILIGTRHGGLAILSGETKFTVVSMASGLLSNSVWRVTEDSLRRLWVHTDVGLECIDRTSLKPLPMKPEFRGERAGGLGVYGGSYLWSYSAGGVKILEYTRPSPPLVPPPVYLTSMHVNGTPQLLDGDLSFPHDRDNCTMEFVCLSFREESTVRYQYRLLGHDTLWSPSTKLRAVTFDALVPGSYRFQVRAFTLAGATSGTPAMIDFTIRPPFWSTWWFTSAIIMTAGGVLMLLYRYRIEKIREVERLRIRIASDLHDDVGSTLTKIAVHSEVIQTTAIPERIMKSSKEIGDMSREIITALSDIVWSIDARHDVLVDLIDRMRSFALETLTAKEVRVKFSTDGVIPTTKLAPNIRQNLYLIFKEAITNIAKHSAATDVLIRITQSGSGMTLVIEDNGAGLQAVPDGSGHGLKNMKMRAERIGGELNFHTDRGLRIVLVLK